MKHIYPKKTKFCFLLLIFCAANTSLAINSHVLDSAIAHNYNTSGILIAHPPDRKDQKILTAQEIRKAKALNRSDRFAKKIAQRSYKAQRPGNGKQIGWFIFWAFLGLGMLLSAAFFGVIYGYILSEGGTGAGYVLGTAIVSAILFVLIYVKLWRWHKKFPGNKSIKVNS